ncbi:LysM domain-containing protein [Arthrobacter sp. StoSoilB5]|uniref:LysM peptidoglycan-binding domain-containing protein n=1 Tax=Arthrobacter sp. StoSoilB5 TaxID=2830992 RepID=UPI001CC5F92B|nr:LysM domain-containing protein [Arthrobacter sp. StoSoilB5]BCW46170.1 peptidoglycan-binding protein LysM [Arthrobacter sp. StoSoilB5]
MTSDPSRIRHDTALAATLLGLGLLLLIIGQSLLGQWQVNAAHGQRSTFEHLLALMSSAFGIAIVSWWILSLGLAAWAALLHGAGKSDGANALAKFSPGFMLRLAFALLSLNFLGVNAAQAATTPEPAWHPTGATVPGLAALHPSAGTQAAHRIPVGGAPSQASDEGHDANKLGPGWQPRPPVVSPSLLARPGARGLAPAHPVEDSVVVKAGDSLWSIAADSLGPFATDVDIALHWPNWYAANRAVIGDNPAALLPGQILQPPTPG